VLQRDETLLLVADAKFPVGGILSEFMGNQRWGGGTQLRRKKNLELVNSTVMAEVASNQTLKVWCSLSRRSRSLL